MRKPPKNAQEVLPGYSDYRKERQLALANEHKRLMNLWQAGLSQDKLQAARMLVLCGLPINEHKSMDPVIRKARQPDGTWLRVSFIRTSTLVPLPFRSDRKLIFFLTDKAVIQKSPLLDWVDANEYMRTFKMNPDSGKNYHDVQASFTRIAYMDIMVEILDAENNVVEHWKCPLIDNARISAVPDGEGNWKPSQSIAKMLEAKQSVSFGLRFYTHLHEFPVPIPIELIIAAGKQYRLMDYMIFLYWRAFAGVDESFIPWRYLQQQFDNEDARSGRWPEYFYKAYRAMKALPDPINQIRADISDAGIKIYPYAKGTTFFEGHPKLGFVKALKAPDSE
jgi:hypothetical protein